MMCRVEEAGPRFALTFDDGPSPRNTPRVLDVLARHGAHATFFAIADRVRRHRELALRIEAEGHELGIHGRWHLPAWMLPRSIMLHDLDASIAVVRGVVGHPARHYRPPFGWVFRVQADWARTHGLTPVLGNIYPRDHRVRQAQAIAHRVLDRLEPGSIVILHDSSALMDLDRSATVEAVDLILREAALRSLRSVSVAELVDRATA